MGREGYLDSSYLRAEEVEEAYRATAIPRLTIIERSSMDKVDMIKAFARSLGVNDYRCQDSEDGRRRPQHR